MQDAQNKITLSQYRGQVVVLNFWATWCPPCVEEMPSLVEMQRRMKAKGVTVLAVSVDVDESAYKQFLKDHNVSLLTVRDPEHKSSELYGTFKYPETYVIDRGGVMRRPSASWSLCRRATLRFRRASRLWRGSVL